MSASPRSVPGNESRRPLLVGSAALGACLIGAFFDRGQFFRSYLIGFLLCLGAPLGSLAVLMLYHLVGGRWGFLIRRLLEAATRTLPLMALLFLPLLFGLKELYPWTSSARVAADPLLAAKAGYLNTGFFIVRALLDFAIWIGLAIFLNRLSEEQDRTGDPAVAMKLQRVSAPGLMLYAGTTFFASVDWIMSLTPHWSSSIFGILFMVGQGVTTMAMVLAVLRGVAGREPLSEHVGPIVLRDLGNLLFMFLMLWAYASFSQLIIIWSGNLPEEIPWYLSRLHTNWKFLSLAILLLYFAVPFGLLLSRRVKQNLETAAVVAGAVLFMRLVEVIWLVEPTFHPKGLFVHWMDFAAPLGLAGVWTAAFFRELSRRPILALHDARVPEVVRHG